MAWRILSREGEVWHVHAAAERRANQATWQLMLSFRGIEPTHSRAIWASYPLESSSKLSLFMQAERISDEALHEVLSRHLA